MTFTPIHVNLHSDEYIHIYKVICVCVYIYAEIFGSVFAASFLKDFEQNSAWQVGFGQFDQRHEHGAWARSDPSDPTALTCVDGGKDQEWRVCTHQVRS